MLVFDWQDFRDGALLGVLGERRTALTVGVFDGVHLGHQALLRSVLEKAPEMLPTVISFRQNPKVFLGKGAGEGDILPLERKLEIFREAGMEALILVDFSLDFSIMPGREFLAVLRDRARPGCVAVGKNFHCGYRMDTGAEGIRAFFAESGVKVEIHESVTLGGDPVSSSRIRRAIREGRLDEAAALLGRPVEFPQAAPDGAM